MSDIKIAKYVLGHPQGDPVVHWKLRQKRLATQLGEAKEITLLPAGRLEAEMPIDDAFKLFGVNGGPLLVFRNTIETEPVGLISAFDLL